MRSCSGSEPLDESGIYSPGPTPYSSECVEVHHVWMYPAWGLTQPRSTGLECIIATSSK
jgi:hypothetical protein